MSRAAPAGSEERSSARSPRPGTRSRSSTATGSSLVGIARSLAKPLGADGITVNCVAPGLTRTRFTGSDLPEQASEEAVARQALPRSLTPEDTAGVVAFLASDAAAAITGQTLVADGGSVLR